MMAHMKEKRFSSIEVPPSRGSKASRGNYHEKSQIQAAYDNHPNGDFNRRKFTDQNQPVSIMDQRKY